MKTRIILTGAFILCLNLNAQEWDYNESTDSSKIEATINFVNTIKVDDLLDKKKRIEKGSKLVTVYRIQIYSGSRLGSNEAQSKFKRKFPELIVETSYEQPYFKTKIGAYRTKLDAHRALTNIQKSFIDAFIFEEKIGVEKL
tara:strand:- start:813 stop:1238 length:426 start_codon:yes stop_codon:yes gene_type:complete